MEPGTLPGGELPRDRLIRNVRLICTRTVRGRHSLDRWEVKYFRALRIVSLILSVLGGTGLITVKAKPDLSGESGAAFIGSLVVWGFGILLQIANEFGVERIAQKARSAAESSLRLETKLEIALGSVNPIRKVSGLLAQSNALLTRFYDILPKRAPKLTAEADELVQDMVRNHHQGWRLPSV